MHWWFKSIFVGILLLSGCSFQSPQEALEPELISFVSVTVSPGTLNVPADSQTGMLISLAGLFSTGDTFSLSLLNAPAGVSLNAITPNLSTAVLRHFKAVLNVASTTLVGTYSITLQATSGTVSKTTTINLTVTQAPANPTFKITVDPNSLEIPRGSSKSTFVYISRIKGFNQNIVLTLDTSATSLVGVTANPVTVVGTAFLGGMTINANATAAPFGIPVVTKVKGTAGSIVKQANLNITIKTPSGELDPGFSSDGIVITDGGRVNLQSNDKIIISRTTGALAANFIELKRLNVNGALDTTFGTNGITTITLSGFDEVRLTQLVVTPDDKMLLLVRGVNGQVPSLVTEDNLLRLQANGQLDPSFGNAGRFTLPEPANLNVGFDQLALRQDGKIVVQGDNFNSSNQTKLVTQVVLANGSGLDATFGTSGTSILSSRLYAYGLDMTVQKDGKIVTVGTYESLTNEEDCVIVRLTASGQFDTSFNGDGINRVAFGHILESFDEVVIDTQGRIVASGTSFNPLQSKLLMARFTPAGNLDDTFSGNGKLELNHETPGVKMALQSDNKQVFFGHEFEEDTLIRQTVGGVFDTSFASDGQVVLPNSINGGFSLAIDSKGRIIVSGADGVARFAP